GGGVPGPGHAPRVLLGPGGGVGDRLAAGGRRHSFHVDEILDREAGPGPGAVQLGDECAHAYTVTRGVTALNTQIASPARRRFRAARVVATLAAREGGPAMRHPARGFRSVVVIVAGAMAALVLIGQGAFGVKTIQTEVIGKVGNSTVYDQTVNGSDKSDAAKAAEGDAAATIQSFGQCASAPRVVSKTKTFEVVQLTSRSCSGGGVLDCNSSG